VEKRKVFDKESLISLKVLPKGLYEWIINFLTSFELLVGASDNFLLENDVLVVTFVEIKSVNRVTSSRHGFGDLSQILCVGFFISCWAEALTGRRETAFASKVEIHRDGAGCLIHADIILTIALDRAILQHGIVMTPISWQCVPLVLSNLLNKTTSTCQSGIRWLPIEDSAIPRAFTEGTGSMVDTLVFSLALLSDFDLLLAHA